MPNKHKINMDVYIILKNPKTEKNELERKEYLAWEKAKRYVDSNRIVYTTVDIQDEKLKEFDEIIWTRVYEPISKIFTKVWIKFNPDDIKQMDEEAFEKTQELVEKYKKIFDEKENDRRERIQKNREKNIDKFNAFIEEKKKMDALIPENMEEMDAICKWKELDFPVPPPLRIKNIKDTYNMSWAEFKEFVKSHF